MSRDETIQFLMVLQSAFPNYKVPDKTVAVNTWSSMLADYDYKLCVASLQSYIATDTSGFAPSIGQIIAKISSFNQSEELNEMEAWALVSKALRDSTYHADERFNELPEVVQNAVGSPGNLRNWAQTDINSIENVIQSNFIKTYRATVKRKKEYDALPSKVKELLGIASNQNQKRIGGQYDSGQNKENY